MRRPKIDNGYPHKNKVYMGDIRLGTNQYGAINSKVRDYLVQYKNQKSDGTHISHWYLIEMDWGA